LNTTSLNVLESKVVVKNNENANMNIKGEIKLKTEKE